MKTLRGIIDTEVSVVSVVKFTGDFEVRCNASNEISIRCFSSNNAKLIYKTFLNDCSDEYKDCLKNSLAFGNPDDSVNADFVLDLASNFSFDITYKEGYTVVSIISIKTVMEII